jgi:hypothetical protein
MRNKSADSINYKLMWIYVRAEAQKAF